MRLVQNGYRVADCSGHVLLFAGTGGGEGRIGVICLRPVLGFPLKGWT